MGKRRQSQHFDRRHATAARAGAPEEFEVTIERILPGGVGLAHAEGRTVFVALSAPGDVARVRVDSVRGRATFASIVEVLQPSTSRVEPPCPYFGRCGGCDFQQLNYQAQLEAKVEIIRDCLRRVARVEPPAEIHITPSPSEWRYRSRARWQHDAVRQFLGYYERGSHRVCDVVECPVAAPEVQSRLTRLRESMREGGLPPDAAEFEAVAGDGGVALAPAVEPEDEREQTRLIAGEHYRFDAGCFFQINHALLEPLVREGLRDVSEETEDDNANHVSGENVNYVSAENFNYVSGETALDLYAGVGLFTLPLARRFERVLAVEGNAASTAYARRNLTDAGLSNARVETAAVGAWLAHNAERLGSVDFVLLDPPRAGAEPEAVRGIIALKPLHISYVSCDPATLARDLLALTGAGYRLASVRAFDLFPQTHHVETVVHLATP
ncbi:MAG TPA: class I SAM-dependent RNA methyltransferase [Pyrinomonadaceae bacterium]|jgi:23S rRNA (uracil1939-C5)-methyltransferase|nr:class I SAM-dependent RNA methyltransferase [Pyrinomonadaceae bacterium]